MRYKDSPSRMDVYQPSNFVEAKYQIVVAILIARNSLILLLNLPTLSYKHRVPVPRPTRNVWPSYFGMHT
ncbi:hypothetical protein CBM2634_U210008 [Cupriavidus taiwanensis]|uniref:Uncharacterized protein n=1 Tax=Cupriavidus taiwanensis TaxID=164546 RepID=A0A375JBZ3_9BURK|nr:hypothetical protein CBM2634_U210008 [Cupriavidus taiwanensis]